MDTDGRIVDHVESAGILIPLPEAIGRSKLSDELQSALHAGKMAFLPGRVRQVSPIVGKNPMLNEYPL